MVQVNTIETLKVKPKIYLKKLNLVMLCSKIQHCIDCHFNFQNITYLYSKYVVTIKMESKRKPQCLMEQPDSQSMKMLLVETRRDW